MLLQCSREKKSEKQYFDELEEQRLNEREGSKKFMALPKSEPACKYAITVSFKLQ